MYPSVIFYTKLYARGFVITHAGLLTKATVAGMLRRTLATLLPLLVTLASLASLALYPTGILTHLSMLPLSGSHLTGGTGPPLKTTAESLPSVETWTWRSTLGPAG